MLKDNPTCKWEGGKINISKWNPIEIGTLFALRILLQLCPPFFWGPASLLNFESPAMAFETKIARRAFLKKPLNNNSFNI